MMQDYARTPHLTQPAEIKLKQQRFVDPQETCQALSCYWAKNSQ